MQKPVIKIDIVSDVVCPWCYIGKRRLEKAIQLTSSKYTFQLQYHPFELNPNMPLTGLNQKEHLSDKFGGEERYHQITEHTTTVAASEGLVFDFAKQETLPNTRRLHSVIQLADTHGKQLEMVEALFKSYFSDGIDLSNNENIISIATQVGLYKEEVEKYLLRNESMTYILQAEKETKKLGIRGVPFYIINNKYGVSGAQLPETFIAAFEEARVSISGEICDLDRNEC